MSELSVPLRPACLKEGHPCQPSPSSLFCLFLFLSPLSFLIMLQHNPPNPCWFEGWCADLVIQIRATLSAQGPSLSIVACPRSFFLLSSSSCGQRRPYKATFLLIHFCQFQRCHSNHCCGEWKETKLTCPSQQGLCFLVQDWLSSANKLVLLLLLLLLSLLLLLGT